MPFIDHRTIDRVNAELKRALEEGDADILAGRYSPKRPEQAAPTKQFSTGDEVDEG